MSRRAFPGVPLQASRTQGLDIRQRQTRPRSSKWRSSSSSTEPAVPPQATGEAPCSPIRHRRRGTRAIGSRSHHASGARSPFLRPQSRRAPGAVGGACKGRVAAVSADALRASGFGASGAARHPLGTPPRRLGSVGQGTVRRPCNTGCFRPACIAALRCAFEVWLVRERRWRVGALGRTPAACRRGGGASGFWAALGLLRRPFQCACRCPSCSRVGPSTPVVWLEGTRTVPSGGGVERRGVAAYSAR
jgi:hypothetical protein